MDGFEGGKVRETCPKPINMMLDCLTSCFFFVQKNNLRTHIECDRQTNGHLEHSKSPTLSNSTKLAQ